MINIVAFIILLFSISCNQNSKPIHKDKPAYITVQIDGANLDDTLTLFFWKNVLSADLNRDLIPPKVIKVAMNSEKEFSFKIQKFGKPGYFLISKEHGNNHNLQARIFDRYLIEPGDSIKIFIKKRPEGYKYSVGWNYSGLNDLYKNYTVVFSGRGVKKYQCRYSIDTLTEKSRYYPAYLFLLGSFDYIANNHYKHSIYISDSILSRYKQSVSPLCIQILKADFYSRFEIRRYQLFRNKFKNTKVAKDTQNLKKLRIAYQKYFGKELLKGVNNHALMISNYFPKYIVNKASTLSSIKGWNSGKEIYDHLKNKYEKQILGDKILTLFLVQQYSVLGGLQESLTEALKSMQISYCRKVLNAVHSTLSEGSLAFNFTLPDTAGNIIRLRDLRGKVVFIDFWFNGCGACLSLYKNTLSRVESYYRDNPNVVFVSISVDKKKERWLKGINGGGYSSTDNRNVINLWTGGNNTLIEHYNIPGYPFLLLVDQKGRIFNSALNDLSARGSLKKQIKLLLRRKGG